MSAYRPVTAWLMVWVASLFFFFEFIQMNMLNTLSTYIQQQFQMDAFELGVLSSTYYWSDTLLLYPAGYWVDRYPAKRMILIGMALSVVGLLLSSMAVTWVGLFLGRLMTGSASAFCLLSILRLASGWFPAYKMAQVTGMVVTMGMLGGVVSQVPLNMGIQMWGWQETLFYLACLGVVVWLVLLAFVKDAPCGRYAVLQTEGTIPFWQSFKQMACRKQNWLMGGYISMMNMPIILLAGLYATPFLRGVHGFNADDASLISAMIFMGMIIGSTLFGFVSDGLRSRKWPMVIGAVMAFIIMGLILWVPMLDKRMAVLLFGTLGVLGGAQIIGYPVVRESTPRHLIGRALGFVSLMIMGLPSVFQPLTGYLIQLNWTGLQVDGIPVYSREDFILGLSVVWGAIGLAVIISLFMPETYGQEEGA